MPAQAITSIVIDASPQQVWDVLVDFDHWSDWNTWFSSIKTDQAPLELGTSVTFTNRMSDTGKPRTSYARITIWDPEAHEFVWEGGPPAPITLLVRGNHWFKLVEQEGGKTLFDHGERVAGWLGWLVPQSMFRDLVGLMERFNEELKRRVEDSVKAT